MSPTQSMGGVAAGAIVAVTGASGFVGRHVCRDLARRGFEVRALVRAVPEHAPERIRHAVVGDLQHASERALDDALAGASALVHLAGRAHVLDEDAPDPDAAYALANVEITARVIAAALRAGIASLVFASTVKVNGESTSPGRPFRPDDAAAPQDAYARSKADAERVVLSAAEGARATAVILRLPLVYGPGVRGNFARLLDAVAAEKRLPVGAIDNRRSIACVGNVCSAIHAVLVAGDLARGVHFVADEPSISTRELVRAIGAALGTPARMSYVPVPLLRFAGSMTGRARDVQRLVSSLEVDTATLRASTHWQPSHTLAQGLAETAFWWRARHSI